MYDCVVEKEWIKIDLVQTLQKQVQFCEGQSRYICGIFITSQIKREIVGKVIKYIIPQYKLQRLRIDSMVTEAIFLNGNIIRVVMANDGARGYRFNGVIVDNDTEKEVIDCVIMPHLRPLHNEYGMYKQDDNPKNRFMTVDISWDDVIKSEKIFNSRGMFEKEYKCMCIGGKYDSPVVTKEFNNDKVMLYNAFGIPKENIRYETEFINKTKQTYLNVTGRAELKDLGFENQINIHMLIDTDIYEGYEVSANDGMVMIVLHEIKNKAPELKDFGQEKFIKSCE